MAEIALTATFLSILALAAMILFTRRRVGRWRVWPAIVVVAPWVAWHLARGIDPAARPDLVSYLALTAGLGLLGVAFRRLEWPARLFLASLFLLSAAYLATLLKLTFWGTLPVAGIALSTVLLGLELAGILLALFFAHEMTEALGREPYEPRLPEGHQSYLPRVCLQVPAYNEPPELLRQTLEALSRLEYPNYMVQVVVNNTVDPALWQPVEQTCRELGRFEFIHLPEWPGYKAGALNEATRRLPPDIEVVAIVDADYIVHPRFLADCLGHLADPQVAFVQTPQHYREWGDSAYLRGLYHAYRYFFDVSMPVRARANAIIFGGTMGLIRASVLREIGGWAEWCITEDAEASLRILAQGWKAVYVNRPYGEGLMPFDFDGLRRQRFRWAFGGVQILRQHFGLLIGRRSSALTWAQRYHYLASGLGWFGDLVGVALGAFLLVTSLLLLGGHQILLRQLVGILLVLPLFLLVSGLLRFGWALRLATGARWRDVPFSLVVMLSLGWTVAQACVRGLLQERGVFLRTPKSKSPSRLRRALVSTGAESAIALAFAFSGASILLIGPRPISWLVGSLLLWQATALGCAPVASVLSQGVTLTPVRRLFSRSPQSQGGRARRGPGRAGRLVVLVPILAAAAFLLFAPAIATAPGDEPGTAGALGLQPLPVLAAPPPPTTTAGSPGNRNRVTPAPSPSVGYQSLPASIVTPRPIASTTPPGPTPSSKPTASPTATPTSHPTGQPSALPSPPISPTPSPR